jgi:DNA-binding NarL/FixJ family response regulator
MRGLLETPVESSFPRAQSWLRVRRLPRSLSRLESREREGSAVGGGTDSPPRSRAVRSAITVVVADEERERRATCLRLLEADRGIRVVREAETAAETLASARLAPRILLVDAKLAMRGGAPILPAFRRLSPSTKVIVLAGSSSGAAVLPALALGAQGCLNRRMMRPLLPKAVRKVAGGEPWISRKLLPRIIETVTRMRSTPLTGRQTPR